MRSIPNAVSVVSKMQAIGFALLLGFTLESASPTNGAPVLVADGGAATAGPGGEAGRLTLRSGEQIVGQALNPTLTLTTSYAQLPLARGWLVSLELEDRTRNLFTITTANSNRFSGFLLDPTLTWQPANGHTREVRRETIARVVFQSPAAHSATHTASRWFRLKSGDYFSAQHLSESLEFIVSGTTNSIAFGQILSVIMSPGKSGTARVSLRDGTTRTVEIRDEVWPIQVEVGPKFELFVGSLERCDLRFEASGTPAPLNAPHGVNSTNLVWVPPGEFVMGSPNEESGRDRDEGPPIRVVIPRGFWIAKYEVTQAEYQSLMGVNPSNTTDDRNRPVERVSWYEAMSYCQKLTESAVAAARLPAGYQYRLPSEAEWEYACRAGSVTRFSFGDDPNDSELADYAWFTRNSDSMTHPVGTRRPNPWGLFDVHGNVWEWCLDRWEGFLPGGSITNRPERAKGPLRVARGGSWLYESRACRSANRDDYGPLNRCSDLGFRVVLAPEPANEP